MANPKKSAGKKVKKNVPVGIAHIQATFNNTIITITDQAGNALSWCSAGSPTGIGTWYTLLSQLVADRSQEADC